MHFKFKFKKLIKKQSGILAWRNEYVSGEEGDEDSDDRHGKSTVQ